MPGACEGQAVSGWADAWLGGWGRNSKRLVFYLLSLQHLWDLRGNAKRWLHDELEPQREV